MSGRNRHYAKGPDKMKLELMIQHGGKIQKPPIADGVSIEWERKGQAGKMVFTVVKTDALKFAEGDAVKFSVDGKALFKGFVFNKARTGLEKKTIDVTCYDQLYYLTKNKETYVLENKTAADVVRMVCEDFGLKFGVIMPTPYMMESRVEDNAGLLDIIQTSLDLTQDATGMVYTVYDNAGKLVLMNDASMTITDVVNISNTGDFDYSTSIDEETYNRVNLIQEKDDNRKVFTAQDPQNMAKWGVLQYTDKLDGDETGGQAKAQAILAQMNRKKRTLAVNDIIGNTKVRGGTILPVVLGLGDMNLSAFMRVEQVQHVFTENKHTMSLRLSGGAFSE